ncbi:hypothetical protein [Corynebacterium auriscanis]|uniref:hypothetical protein n=1 Tax=Corynebacterium auriscanis TaxID=99807 RepID=UPI003CEDF9C1
MKKTSVRVALVAAVALSTTPAIAQADTEDAVQPGMTTPAEDNAAPAEADVAQSGTNAGDAADAQPGTEPAPVDGGNTQPGTTPAVPAQPAPADEAPAQPGTEEPTVPAAPEQPVEPVTPAVPVEPAAPAQPVEPAQPATPAVDAPVAPGADETTTAGVAEPVFTPVSNETPVEGNVPAAPANDAPAPVAEQPATPAAPSGRAQPAAPNAPTAPEQPQQPTAPAAPARPVPAEPKILRQGAIKANLGHYTIDANYVTVPGQTVVNASASDGRATATAPTMSYGTYHDGVAEFGVGTNKPSPVKLDPVTTAVVDAVNNAVRQTPKPVREATKLPAHGDYRIGGPAAGAHVAWKS